MIAIDLLDSFRLTEPMGDAAAVCRRAIDNLRTMGHDDTLVQEPRRAVVNRAMPLRGALVS